MNKITFTLMLYSLRLMKKLGVIDYMMHGREQLF